ncbi:hypothetical protein NUACC26_073610 [Scytonema sp. NUACC26]
MVNEIQSQYLFLVRHVCLIPLQSQFPYRYIEAIFSGFLYNSSIVQNYLTFPRKRI